MGLIRRRSARRDAASQASATVAAERRDLTSREIMELLAGGARSATGVSVTPETALGYAAVLACVRVLAEGVASLPCILYERRADGGKERALRHPLYGLLHDAPNPVQTAFEFYEIGMAQVLLWGNFYAEIEWDARGQAAALWPLPAWRVTPRWDRGGKLYELITEQGSTVYLADYQVLHVPGFGFDGTAGRSMISLAREAIGLGLAAERFGGAFFSNGARPGVVLEHPGQLGDEAYGHLLASWTAQHQGLSNAQRVAILEEGMKLQTLGVPPEDAQFLETRRFQRSEIAAIYRVPLHMIADLERATFSNIEQQSQDFYTSSLQPWLSRWEQRLRRSLLIGGERQRYFAEYLVDALLRGDTQQRYAAYATGRQWGWLSVNDIRRRENMNPVETGDVYLQPLNMVEPGQPEPGGSSGEAEATRSAEVRARTVGGAPEPEQRAAERRAAAAGRQRLAEIHRETLEDVAQRILNRESNDIVNAARRLLPKGGEEFRRWLAEFLVSHRRFVSERLWAASWALMQLAADAARAEGQSAGHDPAGATAGAVEEFARSVNGGQATGWVEELRISVEERLAQAEAEERERLAALEALMAERRENRAAGWARDQAVELVGAVSVMVFGALGVTRIMWATSGQEDCPYCAALDGRVVAVYEWFVPVGGEVAPEGQPPLRPHRNTRHGPLHRGCDCTVVIA